MPARPSLATALCARMSKATKQLFHVTQPPSCQTRQLTLLSRWREAGSRLSVEHALVCGRYSTDSDVFLGFGSQRTKRNAIFETILRWSLHVWFCF